ncbi:hypothetical protein AB0B28_00715 [Glycomyces sp. NPDC046736]|uniref:hypothetical protein n=1 Tax=Glycomyces sp. NPDC046736 TaxID=3155615 RepID=UPI0034032166
MLPQPNFGPDRGPASADEPDPDAKPRKLFRLQVAMWVVVVSAVLAGNILVWGTLTQRNASRADLFELFSGDERFDDPGKAADEAYAVYQSTNFLVSNLVAAGIVIIAAIIAAMCIIRFKTRIKSTRWWAVASVAILFVVGMLMSVQLGLLVAPWVLGAVLALWWLFSSEIRFWLNQSYTKAEKA